MRGAGTTGAYSTTRGAVQSDVFKSHFHGSNVGATTGSNWFYSGGATTLTGAVANGTTSVGDAVETRPANVGVNHIIKV